MDCRDENDRLSHSHSHSGHDGHDDHDHDHGHGHDHVPPPSTNESQSLYSHIYLDHVRTLNESESDMGKSVFKSWDERLDTSKILESDVDEELLIYIPFTGLVRLHSILIRTSADEYAPSVIKVFKNRDDLDFSSVADMKAVTTFNHPEGFGVDPESSSSTQTRGSLDSDGIAEYAVSRAAFSNITSISLYIPSNYGEETTKILYIGLRGEWTKMNKAPIITSYEAAANPKDHKTLVPGEKRVGWQN